jgi:hypothetical protein
MRTRHRRALPALATIGIVLGSTAEAYAIIGRPLTAVSVAGVARRTVRRTANVGATAVGAAAVGAAAAGTAAAIATLPRGCAVGVACGGGVYRPVYQGTTVVYVPQ